MNFTIAIIGDVHGLIELASSVIDRTERQIGRKIDQVFSVGDLGLFFDDTDWTFLTGPKKYRRPEWSSKIRDAWAAWRWPLAMIAGNHEPFNRLRAWDPSHYGPLLTYTNAGELAHRVPELRVVGLSGIYHRDALNFPRDPIGRESRAAHANPWLPTLEAVNRGEISRKHLTFYKTLELEFLWSLPAHPHVILTHDWPLCPPGLTDSGDRPEADLVSILRPQYSFCGHHHRTARFRLG
ncbi:MAG: metallophosphoesterase, partial [Chthoniobacterales bacterium]